MNKIFEIKKKIVLNGNSKIFKNWKELVPELTEQDFINALEWLCDDPCNGGTNGKALTREIGLTRKGIVKLKRVYSNTIEHICTMYREDTKTVWGGDTFYLTCNNEDEKCFANKDGKIPQQYKISISCKDRV